MEICAECLLFGPHGYSTLFHPGTLTCMDQAENHFALRLLARQPLAYRGGNSRVKKREEEVRHLCTSLLPTGSLRLTVSFFWKLPVTLQTLSLSLSLCSFLSLGAVWLSNVTTHVSHSPLFLYRSQAYAFANSPFIKLSLLSSPD